MCTVDIQDRNRAKICFLSSLICCNLASENFVWRRICIKFRFSDNTLPSIIMLQKYLGLNVILKTGSFLSPHWRIWTSLGYIHGRKQRFFISDQIVWQWSSYTILPREKRQILHLLWHEAARVQSLRDGSVIRKPIRRNSGLCDNYP